MNRNTLIKAINLDKQIEEKKRIAEDLKKAKQLGVEGVFSVGTFTFTLPAATMSEMIDEMYTEQLQEIQQLEAEFAKL